MRRQAQWRRLPLHLRLPPLESSELRYAPGGEFGRDTQIGVRRIVTPPVRSSGYTRHLSVKDCRRGQ